MQVILKASLIQSNPRIGFLYRIDIKDSHLVSQAVKEIKPDIIFHLAAETHVDRSLDNPLRFIETI